MDALFGSMPSPEPRATAPIHYIDGDDASDSESDSSGSDDDEPTRAHAELARRSFARLLFSLAIAIAIVFLGCWSLLSAATPLVRASGVWTAAAPGSNLMKGRWIMKDSCSGSSRRRRATSWRATTL